MGVMGGNCCGLARYQTVITLGELHLNTDDKLNLKFSGLFAFLYIFSSSGIGLIVADAALFMINIGNTWTQ